MAGDFNSTLDCKPPHCIRLNGFYKLLLNFICVHVCKYIGMYVYIRIIYKSVIHPSSINQIINWPTTQYSKKTPTSNKTLF